jgi:hypothetical protein
MQGRIIFALFAFIAVAVAQQTFSVYPLSSGISYAGSLSLQLSQTSAFLVNLYSIFVPENATSVNVTLVNTNYATCSYITVVVMSSSLPCDAEDYLHFPYEENMCSNGYNVDDGIPSSYTEIFYAGEDQYEQYEFSVNRNWYISVGRYYSEYYGEACAYSLTATINQTCPTGSVGLSYELDSDEYTQCSLPYTTVTNFPSTFNATGDSQHYPVYKLNIPVGTGYFNVKVNVSNYDDNGGELYIYGKAYGSPSEYNNDCEYYDYITVGNYSIYNFNCTTPRSGDWYFVIYSEDYAFNATVTFYAPVVCANGTGGNACQWNCTAYSPATLNVQIPALGWYYFYIDIPANYSSNRITLTAASAQDVVFYYRRNGFPDDSYSGYEGSEEYQDVTANSPASFSLSQFDWYVPGRIYFGLYCENGANGCSATVTTNGTLTTSSTTLTTLSSTTSTTQTSSTSMTTHSMTTHVPVTSTSTTKTSTLTSLTSTSTSTSTSGKESSSAAFVIPSALFALVTAALALF